MLKKDILHFMDLAIKEAKNSGIDIPVGAIIVKDGEIISKAVNRREQDNLVISHAEILALQEANKKLNSWRLEDCDLYVTLEPCPMCAWAIINSKIKNVYFGSYDLKYGALGSVLNLQKLANSKVNVIGGIEEERCNKLLEDYFKELRNEK